MQFLVGVAAALCVFAISARGLSPSEAASADSTSFANPPPMLPEDPTAGLVVSSSNETGSVLFTPGSMWTVGTNVLHHGSPMRDGFALEADISACSFHNGSHADCLLLDPRLIAANAVVFEKTQSDRIVSPKLQAPIPMPAPSRKRFVDLAGYVVLGSLMVGIGIFIWIYGVDERPQ